MSIVDLATDCEYDLYGARKTKSGWVAAWANTTSIAGTGIYPRGFSTRGSGFAPLAGVIWPDELKRGQINHALIFDYPSTLAGGPVQPATAADGRSVASNAIPEGAHLQLDPALDLSRLHLTAYELTIAKALQKYGMYLGDTGSALGLYAVGSQSQPRDAYSGVLPHGPFAYLDNIPLSAFRVLKLPAQQHLTPLAVVPVAGCPSPVLS